MYGFNEFNENTKYTATKSQIGIFSVHITNIIKTIIMKISSK